MRQNWVIANWKMHGDKASVESLLKGFIRNIQTNAQAAVCPPAVFLPQAQALLQGSEIQLGAQNLNPNESGAYTGEISAAMLKEFGCQLVLVGHSERRTLYAETDAMVAEKFVAAGNAGLVPVLCIGETDEERTAGQTESVILRQLDAALDAGGTDVLGRAVIAYEPVWAIGTGKTATPEQAQEVHGLIRNHIAELDQSIAADMAILYGGSVKANNADELFAKPDIDGGLIGGASLDVEEFSAICRAAG